MARILNGLENIESDSLDTKMENSSLFRWIDRSLKTLAYAIMLGLITSCLASEVKKPDLEMQIFNGAAKEYTDNISWVESSGWTITSYGDVNEELYDGKKIEVFNRAREPLGFYREDFLEQVRIDGSGVGDGNRNDKTKFLHYDYDINDGKTCYLSDVSLGAYDNELIPWNGDKPSVAVNPVLPYGIKIRFKDLGSDGSSIPEWIQDILLSKIFYADDKFHLSEEDRHKKKIDVYVGLIEGRDNSNPQSLYMENATITIESNPDLNNDGVVDSRDLKIFTENWLWEGPIGANQADLNLDGKVDFRDYAYYSLQNKK